MNRSEIRIRGIVEELCSEHRTRDPFRLCDALDIIVLCCPLPNSIRGFYLCINDIGIIYINQALDPSRARSACAHELGHAVLHSSGYNSMFMRANTHFVSGRYEREAEQFCDYLLHNLEYSEYYSQDGTAT